MEASYEGGGASSYNPATSHTLTLSKDLLTDAGLAASLPNNKATMQALTAADAWNYQGVDFTSVMALSNATGSDGSSKIPVLYLYKSGTHTTLTNFIANTSSLGKIKTITVNLMDGGAQKGSKFTMEQTVSGAATTVLSSNDDVSALEHVYTFDAANDGTFRFANTGSSDCKVASIVIEYEQ